MEIAGFEVEVNDEADESVRDIILTGLRRFNEEVAGPLDLRPLNALLRDHEGKVLGGLWGRTYWHWLFVEFFYLPSDLRGLNFGSRLLKAAEEEAAARGCIGAWLDTFAFQAPGFYERHGYQRFGELADLPQGQFRIFFAKRL